MCPVHSQPRNCHCCHLCPWRKWRTKERLFFLHGHGSARRYLSCWCSCNLQETTQFFSFTNGTYITYGWDCLTIWVQLLAGFQLLRGNLDQPFVSSVLLFLLPSLFHCLFGQQTFQSTNNFLLYAPWVLSTCKRYRGLQTLQNHSLFLIMHSSCLARDSWCVFRLREFRVHIWYKPLEVSAAQSLL